VPPWFNGAMELLLEPIKADLQVLKDDVQVLKDDLQVLKGDMQVVKGDLRVVKAVQSNVWKFTSRVSNVFPSIPLNFLLMIHFKDHNLSAGVGEDAKLEVVPFTNGQDPTKAPVGFFCLSPTSESANTS
jgi:hypothetical protein